MEGNGSHKFRSEGDRREGETGSLEGSTDDGSERRVFGRRSWREDVGMGNERVLRRVKGWV